MMAPHMAASVCCSLVLFLFLFVCPVLSNDFPISFTRNELLDIRNSTPDNLLPTFMSDMYVYMYVCTVGTESIQTPLNFSLCYIAAIC